MLERGARVTDCDPKFGVTKNPHGTKLKLIGEQFECTPGPGGCGQIKVRFTNKNGDQIVISGEHISNEELQCVYPEYPSPETLTIDVTMNGIDWSGDKVQFAYIDPFVLGVKPRLISPKGTTTLLVEGYGMAHTGDDSKQQIAFKHYPDNK